MFKRVSFASLALVGLFANPAHAQEEQTLYAGAGFGQVSVALDDLAFDESGTGFKVFGGVLFNPYFGMEAAYWDGASAESATGGAEIATSALVVQGIGRYPFLDRFAAFGKLGVGFYRLDVEANVPGIVYNDSESGNELVYGVGVSGKVWRSIEARIEWEAFAFDIESEGGDASMLSLSGVYRF